MIKGYSQLPTLDFAKKYFNLCAGIITIKEEMPNDIRKKFWIEWIKLRNKIIENEKNGVICSAYPVIPIEDKDPNEWQYIDLLNGD